MTLKEVRERLEATRDSLRALAELTELDDTQAADFDRLETEDRELAATEEVLVRREERRTEVRSRLEAGETAAETADDGIAARTVNFRVDKDPADILEDRNATRSQLVDAATRALVDRVASPENMEHVRSTLKRHAGDRQWVRNLIARSTETYERAWAKMVTGSGVHLTEEERAALSVGTNANGGFLVPTHLDPTVILTNAGSSNVIRNISRVVGLTSGNSWNGVSSAGVTASWDGELVEVSDDSPTFAKPNIPTYKAQAFVQTSIEAFEDISGLASDVLGMFGDARDRLEGAAHATGSGSGQPTGIFTALDANTNVEIVSTTAATIGEVDIHALYRGVPVRYRSNGTWVMNPVYSLAIKRLGTAVSSTFSGDLSAPVSDRILGRPQVESDEAPSVQTTTAKDNEIVFGDFSNFVVVDKPGSFAVEFIPHLFNTANNLPDGRRGWYAHWRTGSDSVNDDAFRLLQDKTSA